MAKSEDTREPAHLSARATWGNFSPRKSENKLEI